MSGGINMQKINLSDEIWYTYNPERLHLKNAIIRHGTILAGINGDITIGENTVITQYCYIDGPTEIGVGCIIGPRTVMVTHDHDYDNIKAPIHSTPGPIKPIKIEGNCYIGAGCIILQGVTIHKNTVIGAGSIVTRDIPSGVVAFGQPCKVVRTRGEK